MKFELRLDETDSNIIEHVWFPGDSKLIHVLMQDVFYGYVV